MDARVAVPVPGAAEVGALLDDPDVAQAGLAQPGGGEQAAEPAADDQDVDVVGQGLAGEAGFGVRVVVEVAELARGAAVLAVAVGADAPVALGPVALAQGVRVEVQVGDKGVWGVDMRVLFLSCRGWVGGGGQTAAQALSTGRTTPLIPLAASDAR